MVTDSSWFEPISNSTQDLIAWDREMQLQLGTTKHFFLIFRNLFVVSKVGLPIQFTVVIGLRLCKNALTAEAFWKDLLQADCLLSVRRRLTLLTALTTFLL